MQQSDNKWHIAGIDFGSKTAGTTIIAHLKGGQLQLLKSEKKI